MSTKLAPAYSSAVFVSLLLQAACLVLLDATISQIYSGRMFLLSFVFYWLGFIVVVLTQPQAPSRWGLIYVRFGFVIWMAAAVFIVPIID